MARLIPRQIMLVHSSILNWEDANGVSKFSPLNDSENYGQFVLEFYRSNKLALPAGGFDKPTNEFRRAWCRWVTHIFVDSFERYIDPNIRDIFTNPVCNVIRTAARQEIIDNVGYAGVAKPLRRQVRRLEALWVDD